MRGDSAQFLEELARDVAAVCRVDHGATCGLWMNVTGGPLYKPSGRDAYPAFWVRDFALSAEAGLFSYEEIRHALLLIATTQPSSPIRFPNGSFVPAGAVADHILFDGTPIFFPGTCNPADQGGRWGVQPPFDNAFFFILLAAYTTLTLGHTPLLSETIADRPLLDCLERAFFSVPSDPKTELVVCSDTNRGANFGFLDAVYQTGSLLMASLLRLRAAHALREMADVTGDSSSAFAYQNLAETISGHIGSLFQEEDGGLRASTGRSAQPDLWSTAYAVHYGLLEEEREAAAAKFVTHACLMEGASWHGQIRPVPPRRDFNEQTCWESLVIPIPPGTYQNGAFWAFPAGWVCDAMARVDESAARTLAEDLTAHFMEEDFRLDPPSGAPWECVHPPDYRKEGPYLASVAVPLIAFRRMGWIPPSTGRGQ
jgi:hypothetical protein